ncbi:MAG TPA: SRPBCC domain-containing protein [Gemmatimonadaceae bacterium]|nr:SRPBCC domain-containing protein [Gemmatimonadaceae bacterium]
MAEERNELVITRTFDAPRELVFKAWTDPERIKQWLAPRGFKIPVAEGDLRSGGKWRQSMVINTPTAGGSASTV